MNPLRKAVLMTGATGFIGQHVARRLHADGHLVVSLQRSLRKIAGTDMIIRVGDLGAPTIAEALRGQKFDWLIHLASAGVNPDDRDIERMMSINIDATRHLVLEAAKWPASAIFVAGTGSAYDLRSVIDPVSETHRVETRNLYGASKAAGSIAALATAEYYKLPLAVGQMFGVFGAGEPKHRLLPHLVGHLAMNKRVPLSAGTQRRDMMYIADVVDGILALTQHINDTQSRLTANISTGAPVSVRAFAEAVAKELGASAALLGFGDVPIRPDEIRCFSGDPTLIKTLTGWRSKTEIPDAIEKSIREMRTMSVEA